MITAPEALNAVFRSAGREMSDYVDMLPVDPFYRLLWEDGDFFDYDNDVEALERQIVERNPDDLEGYRRFLEYSKKVFEVGYEALEHANRRRDPTLFRFIRIHGDCSGSS